MKKTALLLAMITKFADPDLCAQDNAGHFIEKTIAVERGNCRLEGSLLAVPGTSVNQPLAILIAGSGPTDRNGNSPAGVSSDAYKLIAEALAKAGISSFRYDKRGVAKSKPPHFTENGLVFDDYINDAIRFIDYLRDSAGFRDIYLVGHSEGSLIGMVAATRRPVKGYISLSGAGRPIDIVIREQVEKQPDYVKKAIDSIFGILKENRTVDSVPPYLYSLFRPSIQPYMISWLKYNPVEEIKKLSIPALILQGSCDVQVGIGDAENLHRAYPAARLDIIPGMTHTLKDAGGDCRDDNKKTYTDPTLPLNTRLVKDLVSFIREKK